MQNAKCKILIIILLLLAVPSFAFGAPASSDFEPVGGSQFIKIPKFFQGTVPGPAGKTTFGGVILIILNVILLIVGSLSVLFLMWGGLRYITAYGNEEWAEAAKRIIKHSILGLVIVVLSFAIIAMITNILVGGRVFGP